MDANDLGLYVMRMVVLLETEPQSNKYTQVMLNAEQFKKFSDHLVSLFQKPIDVPETHPDYEVHQMTFSDEEITLPSEIRDIN